jgi:hypothetical protein
MKKSDSPELDITKNKNP